MSEYITDPEILKKLQGSSEPAESEYVSDPAVLAQLNGVAAEETATGPELDLGRTAAQTAAATGMGLGPTGMKELSQAGMQAAKPFVQSAVGPTAAIYRANPILAPIIDAAGIATMGVPPIAASQSAMGVYDKYKGAIEAGKEGSKFVSQGAITTAPTGSAYPETVPGFREMQRANPALSAKLSEIYSTGGGNNAVKAWLTGPEGQVAMKDPRFAAAAESYLGKVPGALAQAGRVAAPVLKGLAKVAGPAGMAMNLYDASQMAEQTQLGSRLAAGQGQAAEQAFRSGPVQSYQGPQIPAAQAQNVLQSGSARDIQYFGGRDKLTELMRRKAAEKVLGPIAP